jgi:hypothetical protein
VQHKELEQQLEQLVGQYFESSDKRRRKGNDRAYWKPKLDPTELIPAGSVVGLFNKGVSKTTAGALAVRIVAHKPDTIGGSGCDDLLPRSEEQFPDGLGGFTYSSHVQCLVACVGEVEVFVSSTFTIPQTKDLVFLMPSGRNDGLAAISDGSSTQPLLGYLKPGQREPLRKPGMEGHVVTCCVEAGVLMQRMNEPGKASLNLRRLVCEGLGRSYEAKQCFEVLLALATETGEYSVETPQVRSNANTGKPVSGEELQPQYLSF